MNTGNQQQGLTTRAQAATAWLTEWVEAQQGSGLILFFWLFVTTFLSAMVLLCLGVLYWSSWIFFLGLICVRFFIYLFQIGGSFLERIDPSHG